MVTRELKVRIYGGKIPVTQAIVDDMKVWHEIWSNAKIADKMQSNYRTIAKDRLEYLR